MWDWADPKAYLHDVVSTDRRNPTLNANGPLYGALELSADYLPVLDPVANTISQIKLTVRDPNTPRDLAEDAGAVAVLGRRSDLDQQEQRPQPDARRARPLWLTSAVRPPENPAFCKEGSDHPSAKLFPIATRGTPPRRCTTRRPNS